MLLRAIQSSTESSSNIDISFEPNDLFVDNSGIIRYTDKSCIEIIENVIYLRFNPKVYITWLKHIDWIPNQRDNRTMRNHLSYFWMIPNAMKQKHIKYVIMVCRPSRTISFYFIGSKGLGVSKHPCFSCWECNWKIVAKAMAEQYVLNCWSSSFVRFYKYYLLLWLTDTRSWNQIVWVHLIKRDNIFYYI